MSLQIYYQKLCSLKGTGLPSKQQNKQVKSCLSPKNQFNTGRYKQEGEKLKHVSSAPGNYNLA